MKSDTSFIGILFAGVRILFFQNTAEELQFRDLC